MSDEDVDGIDGMGTRAPRTAKAIKRKRLLVSKTPYEVGYARPPVESRYKPGQSGNPSGRPRGAKNKPSREIERIKAVFSKIADQKITIRQGTNTASMSKLDYILHSAIDRAAKGHAGMTRMVIEMALRIEASAKRLHDEWMEEAIAYKIYHTEQLNYRKLNGIRGVPDPVPHPDDVRVDRYGNVSIVGPLTPEEKRCDDAVEAQRNVWKTELAELDLKIEHLMGKLKDRRCNRERVRKELFTAIEDADALKTLLQKTSREARYPSK